VTAEVVHDGREMTAIARYFKLPGKNSAELFLLVDEKYQAKGLGLVLLENLSKLPAARAFLLSRPISAGARTHPCCDYQF